MGTDWTCWGPRWGAWCSRTWGRAAGHGGRSWHRAAARARRRSTSCIADTSIAPTGCKTDLQAHRSFTLHETIVHLYLLVLFINYVKEIYIDIYIYARHCNFTFARFFSTYTCSFQTLAPGKRPGARIGRPRRGTRGKNSTGTRGLRAPTRLQYKV